MKLEQIFDSYVEHKNVFLNFAWKRMAGSSTNCVISPFCAEVLLSYLLLGSEGETREEIRGTLGYKKDSLAILKSSVGAILSDLQNNDTIQSNLGFQNRIFLQKNYYCSRNFLDLAKYFFCKIEKVRFSRLSEYHELRVYDCLDLDDCTKMILVNDLKLEAKWLKKFESCDNIDFHTKDRKIVKRESMARTSEFNCCELEEIDAKLVELEGKGQITSMVLIIPNQLNGLPKVDANVNLVLNVTSKNFKSQYISLTVPKFNLEASIYFKGLLQDFGIKRMFTEGKANLNGFALNQDDLHVSDIVQDVRIAINDDGISSPSSFLPKSYVNIDGLSSERRLSSSSISQDSSSDESASESPLPIVVNRPFAFYVKVKGVILLIGRVEC